MKLKMKTMKCKKMLKEILVTMGRTLEREMLETCKMPKTSIMNKEEMESKLLNDS